MLKNCAVMWCLVSTVSLGAGLSAAGPPDLAPASPEEMKARIITEVEDRESLSGQEALRGVVIEEVPKHSALEKAGVRVGDVIISWERLPSAPANPKAAEGVLTSYFNWLELEMEQVPRGEVVLRGQRGRAPLEFKVEPGVWGAKVRPVLSAVLDEIFERGKGLLISGDLRRAVATWRLLADCVPDSDSRDLLAWIHLRIGEAWGERGEWEEAIKEYRDGITIGTRVVQAPLFEAIGKAYERKSDYSAAKASYSSALQVSEREHAESLALARALTNLGDSAWAQGELNRAHEYFLKALVINERLAPQSLPVASSLNNLGVIARSRGELDRASELFFQALRIDMELAPLSIGASNSLNNLGDLAWVRGELIQARDFHLRALQMRNELAPRGFEVAVSLNNLGLVEDDLGELDRAFDYYHQSLQLFEAFAPQSVFVATSLNNLGGLTWARGELDRSLDYHLRALWIHERLAPESLDVATSLDNIGTLAWSRGEFGRAQGFQLRALQIRQQLAPGSLEVALSLHNLGSVARDRGDFYQAQQYLLQALKIRKSLAPQSLLVAFSMHNLGDVALALGEVGRAHNYFLQALQIFRQVAPESFDVARTLNRLGDVALARRELSLSYQYYSQSVEELEYRVSRLGGSYNVQAGFRFQHDDFYRDLLGLLLVQNRFAEAFQILERFRAQTFLTMLSERDLAFTADIPEGLDRERRRVAVLYDRTLKKLIGLNVRDHAAQIETVRTELRRLEDEAGDIEATIRKASPRLTALRYPHPLDAAEARQVLDPGTLVLSYSVGEEKTFLYTISPSGDLDINVLPLREGVLRFQVKQLLGLMSEARIGSSIGAQRLSQLRQVSQKLYATLLGPVAERIGASKRLLILPDGPLHVLPFAALMRGSDASGEPGDGQYLAEWKPLHVALSTTVFSELKQRRRPSSGSQASQASFQLAAFGDPVYPQSLTKKSDSTAPLLTAVGLKALGVGDAPHGDPIIRSAAERGVFDWQPLPFSRREVESIAKLFPTQTVYTFLGLEALEDRVKSLDPRIRILHLAVHGYTDEHLPSNSFVALTIPEETKPDSDTPERDNGLLQVWEIFERVRLNADLVVLSACDTALGEELGGEGLIGLTRAFQYAGARSVLASLWSVNDQATSELMIRFYKHLLAGLPKDQALQAAQQELIRGPIEVTNEKGEVEIRDFSAPYYWAGFQLYGDWK